MIEVLADPFWDDGFRWFWLIGLFQPIFWIALIALLVSLFRRRPQGREISSALAILEARYARGEISREEFLERRSILSGQDPRSGE